MRRIPSNLFLLLTALAGVLSSACQSGGVGDPCVPEDEYKKSFSGYSETEVNVESRSFQCETRVCLVANFKGRVSCPYGNAAKAGTATADPGATLQCYVPGKKEGDANEAITAVVPPQLDNRKPNTAVYCSCRCDGPDTNVRYCTCPSGYACQKLVTDYGFGSGQLAGSYCIKDGTQVADSTKLATQGNPCSDKTMTCGEPHPYNIH